MPQKSHYRSATGEQIVLSQYDKLLAQWPVPYQSLVINTRHGKTHIISSGDPSAPPLFLLHGRSANTMMWILDVARYSEHYRVYAVDILGEPGKSDPTRLRGWTNAYSEWMLDIFDQLAIRQATMLGFSFGSWLALKTALAMPERLSALVLMSPAGFTFPDPKTIFRAALTLLPGEIWIRSFLNSLAVKPLNDEVWQLMAPILEYYRSNPEPPLPFSDAELRRIMLPTLLLIGAQDVYFAPQRTLERAKRLIPHLTGELIPAAGHMLPYDQQELVMDRVLKFLVLNRAN